MMKSIDNFLLLPYAVRDLALTSEYVDYLGPDGQVYKRVTTDPIPTIQETLEAHVGPVEMLGMGFRLNYQGELPNAAIHSDLGWGTHALVVHLTDTEQDLGGTAFWKHKATNSSCILPDNVLLWEEVKDDWDNEEAWEMVDYAPMKFNRAVIYESKMFHSRYPFEAFGNSPETGRLIVVAFFTPKGVGNG